MKVIVERTGGVTGAKLRGERSDQELSPEQRAAIAQLEQRSPDEIASQPGADYFVYRIEIEDEHGKRVVRAAESHVAPVLREIVRR